MIKDIFFIMILALIPAFSGAAELKEYNGPDIKVRYDAPLKSAAMRIASDYRQTRADMESKLGLSMRNAPVVVLLRDNVSFQEIARNKLVTAFAMPQKDLIVIDYSMMNKTPFELQATFRHELIHLLLHQNIGPSSLPKWLDEGVAQWASGGVADILRTGEKDLLQQALLSNHLIPLIDISVTFPEPANRFSLAYEESRSFIEFIVKSYGEAKLLLIIHGLASDRDIENAVHEALGVSLNSLERQWRKGLDSEYSWVLYVAEHVYWLVFIFAAAITLGGFCVVRRRMKNYRDEEDEESTEKGDDQDSDG
jgi:hypothetical protein